MVTKHLNIKNRKNYFYDGLINLEDFDPNLLELDRKSSMDINIYHVSYFTNPLYLLIHELDGFIEEIKGDKCLNIALTDSNNDALIK